MDSSLYSFFFETGKQSQLFKALEQSSYDEMGEIDLRNNSYHHLYHTVNKYYIANINASYEDLFAFVADHVVHPADREAYVELMDPKTMAEKMEHSPTPNFRYAQFRMKTQTGDYRYVEQILVGGREFGCAHGIYRFYVFDIENKKERELNAKSPFSQRHPEVDLLMEKAFFKKGQQAIDKDKKTHYALIAFDIEHFTLYNSWYGAEKAKHLLLKIADLLKPREKDPKFIPGYFSFDHFAILCPHHHEDIVALYQQIRNAIYEESSSRGFKPGIGVVLLEDHIPLVDAYEHALLAASFAKHEQRNSTVNIAYYRPNMRVQTEEESNLLTAFKQARQNGEVTFYIQPQVRFSSSAIVGGEALARWVKPDGALISPAEFVPVLESSGFVVDLDLFIWEKVCAYQKSLIDQGIQPVPISVNVSRVDILTLDVADYLEDLVNRYGLTTKLIKVEITESAYASSTELIRETVSRLRAAGFTVLMDDFGSGYSSLNMLSSINVDVIKLDALFLKTEDENKQKGIHLLESVVSMATSLGLPFVVEGVETKTQRDFLEKLGCRYAQGFYYFKAIPQQEFTELIKDEKRVDRRGFVAKSNEQFRIREFLDHNIYSDSMLNQILGAVAIYLWHGEDLDIIRFNEQFYETVGVPDFHERITSIQRWMPPEDIPVYKATLQKAIEERENGAEALLHFANSNGTMTSYIIHFFYLGDQDEGKRFYGSAHNITKRAELQQQMQLITRFSSDSIIFLKRVNDAWVYSVIAHGQEDRIGMGAKEFEEALNTRSFHKRLHKTSESRSRRNLEAFLKDHKTKIYDLKYVNPSHQTIELSVRLDPVDDPASNVDAIVTFREKGS